jgi:energy-coupling factor transport system permease protein
MTPLLPAYRREASALHAARASVGSALCAAIGLVAMLYDHPLVLAGALAGTVAAGMAAGVGREIRRAAMLAVPFALVVALVNPLVNQQGNTLLVRGGEVLGRRFDVTLEALAFGGIAGLRIALLVLAFALFSAAVDPDEVLRLFRRFSYRSALTASLATRLVPVLARDAARMSDAARCRPAPLGRATVARAALSGALERAIDLAAALELRGYASARRPPRKRGRWSRHDIRVGSSAAALAAIAVAGKFAAATEIEPYPTLTVGFGPPALLVAAAAALLPVLPLAGTAARLGVARA